MSEHNAEKDVPPHRRAHLWCTDHDCPASACAHEHPASPGACPHGCQFFSRLNRCPDCRASV